MAATMNAGIEGPFTVSDTAIIDRCWNLFLQARERAPGLEAFGGAPQTPFGAGVENNE